MSARRIEWPVGFPSAHVAAGGDLYLEARRGRGLAFVNHDEYPSEHTGALDRFQQDDLIDLGFEKSIFDFRHDVTDFRSGAQESWLVERSTTSLRWLYASVRVRTTP